jgi:two-component system sensor histidine kinase/response regulator
VARAILEQRGHRVEVVSNGLEAVARAGRERFDAILMDLRMPQLNGLEATRKIRALKDRALADVPVIALTAHVLDADRQRCLDAGMNAFVTKPFEAEELARTVEHVVSRPQLIRNPARRAKRASSPDPSEFAAASAVSTINLERTLVRINGDRRLLRDMARFFQEDTPALVKSLQEAVDSRDAAAAELAAHSIKGLASNFDASPLYETAEKIEELARGHRIVAARELVDRLRSQTQQVCDDLARAVPQ